MSVVIAGAGFSGAVVGRQLAESGIQVEVFESRNHTAGNCHTERDPQTGVMIHAYGPHIFHTQSQEVWEYINRFGRFAPYAHSVRAISQGRVYSLPINLLTINQYFGTTMSPAEAASFIADRSDKSIEEPVSFEDQALKFVGKELYEAFFAGYTSKQWGRSPKQLPASILKRLPLRFDYNDTYFSHPYMGIPIQGYTSIVESMLDHANIRVHLESSLARTDVSGADHVFWTGPIDDYFQGRHGPLAYRTLDFQTERYEGNFQGCPVMNYCDESIPFTRTTEFKHFAPWESHDRTIVYRESSRERGPDDIPYYPIRLVSDKEQLHHYVEEARAETSTTFLGRLGTYRYLDMDVAIKEALEASAGYLACRAESRRIPAFFVEPLPK